MLKRQLLWAHNKLVIIYAYMGVSVYWLLILRRVYVCVRVCVFVCVIPNQSTSKKPQTIWYTIKLLTWFSLHHDYKNINPIQYGLLRGCSRMGWRLGRKSSPPSLPKNCQTYLAMMKLGSYTLPNEDPKNIWITWPTPWVLLTSEFFYEKSINFAISRNTDIDFILIYNFYLF